MSAVVLDSSIALTWCFEDEATRETDAMFERVRDDGAVVPGIWHLEVGNVLIQAEKRGRIAASDVAKRLDLISDLPIAVDHETAVRAWREILSLARMERLTAYDATYLDLAMRRRLPLMTLDRELARAALRLDVVVLPKASRPSRFGGANVGQDVLGREPLCGRSGWPGARGEARRPAHVFPLRNSGIAPALRP